MADSLGKYKFLDELWHGQTTTSEVLYYRAKHFVNLPEFLRHCQTRWLWGRCWCARWHRFAITIMSLHSNIVVNVSKYVGKMSILQTFMDEYK